MCGRVADYWHSTVTAPHGKGYRQKVTLHVAVAYQLLDRLVIDSKQVCSIMITVVRERLKAIVIREVWGISNST